MHNNITPMNFVVNLLSLVDFIRGSRIPVKNMKRKRPPEDTRLHHRPIIKARTQTDRPKSSILDVDVKEISTLDPKRTANCIRIRNFFDPMTDEDRRAMMFFNTAIHKFGKGTFGKTAKATKRLQLEHVEGSVLRTLERERKVDRTLFPGTNPIIERIYWPNFSRGAELTG